MTELERKAIQHCIDQIRDLKHHSIYGVVCLSLNKENIDSEARTNILRDTNNAVCTLVAEPIAELRRWLEALIKNNNETTIR